ncbi:Acetyltransferase (GNAT) family protein [Microbacterium oxydans]|uniref:Acetyltransferase (GNAT) family protein n=1 Tax=Microbacterium oxydans TaxID=82380 RepID=A0A0F0KG93_9MICO|nr:GNAT family N-acetyltransferase [Microbacterium oxydans]KJL18291.1 Acetyltransferase (GNAT) family protein [Microbacterium oxydans]
MTDVRQETPIALRAALAEDAEWIAELRAEVLRADLERLGRYDEVRVRQRFRDAFEPGQTRIIVVDSVDVGSVALRPDGGSLWLEHFYIAPSHQGRGIGGRVLTTVLDGPGRYRLNVLRGSPARGLYERHGFVVDSEDDVDVFMTLDDRGQTSRVPEGR